MCNLYRMTRAQAEISRLFKVEGGPSANVGSEVYPGYPGLVVTRSVVGAMVWGFPLVLKGAKGQALKPKPVNNARSDKLDSFMWRSSFAARRCLIPATGFAEAEGAKGAMTRTWFSLPGEEVFALAGIWRDSAEWGNAYSMVMTSSYGVVRDVHDRMPVIVAKADWEGWIEGSVEEAMTLCRPYEGSIEVERSNELWSRGRRAGGGS